MKSLSLTTPHVIVMVGLPGSGKSFFAEHFSETFSAPLVSWNRIRDELFNEPTYSRDEDAIIARVASHMLSELLKTPSTILLESDTSTQASRLALARAVRQAGHRPLFVWVQTDAAAAQSRASKKGMPSDAYQAAVKRFTPLKESDPFVVISGKHTYASQLKIVLRRLSDERAVAANQPARMAKVFPGRRVTVQ